MIAYHTSHATCKVDLTNKHDSLILSPFPLGSDK